MIRLKLFNLVPARDHGDRKNLKRSAVTGVLYGMKPAITAIVLFAAYRIGLQALKNWLLWTMAALAFLAIFIFDAPLPMIIMAAALLGAIGGKFAPQKFTVGGGHGGAKHSYGPALIDDHTSIPAHAQFSWLNLSKLICTGGAGPLQGERI